MSYDESHNIDQVYHPEAEGSELDAKFGFVDTYSDSDTDPTIPGVESSLQEEKGLQAGEKNYQEPDSAPGEGYLDQLDTHQFRDDRH
ncbi:hypothetical protein HDE_04827 [Halotydeus destructor]|nr:hypothetical protein HDE_04827 [Halotydeus destructor]